MRRSGGEAASLGVRPWLFACAIACGIAGLAVAARPQPGFAQTLQELRGLSIAQLATIRVTSVAKSPEPLSDAPAAIYVITHDEIMRSGFTTVPEIERSRLRLTRRQGDSRRGW